jgi:hypothetical protein
MGLSARDLIMALQLVQDRTQNFLYIYNQHEVPKRSFEHVFAMCVSTPRGSSKTATESGAFFRRSLVKATEVLAR